MQLSLDDASPALSNVVFCVLDLETAGSSAEVGGITEIGAVKYRAEKKSPASIRWLTQVAQFHRSS